MLASQVDSQGGMYKKYQYLVTHLTDHPEAKVTKVTRDQIIIQATNRYATTSFIITESFNEVRVDWIANMAALGKHNHSWSFPNNYSQEKILDTIMTYLATKRSQMF